jgi:polar amino acid transport system substrate-binding protein
MKKAGLVLFSTLLIALYFTSTVTAGPIIDRIQKKGQLVVGTSGDYPPLTAKTRDGKLIGLDMDVAAVIAGAMGVKLKTVDMPFDKLLPALEAGKIDMIISCMTMTPKRNLKVAFVGPYFISGQSLLTTKETALAVTSAADMDKPDFMLAVTKGTTSEMIARRIAPKANIVVAENSDDALKLLLQKKVKGIMADYLICKVMAFRYKEKGLIATEPFSFEPIGIALGQNDPLLVNMLTNYISMLRGNGELTAMTRRWLEDASWMKDLPSNE